MEKLSNVRPDYGHNLHSLGKFNSIYWMHTATNSHFRFDRNPNVIDDTDAGDVVWQESSSKLYEYLEIGRNFTMKQLLHNDRYQLFNTLFPLKPISGEDDSWWNPDVLNPVFKINISKQSIVPNLRQFTCKRRNLSRIERWTKHDLDW